MAKIISLESSITLKESDFRREDVQFNQKHFDKSDDFHIRFIESLTASEIYLNGRYVSLRPEDIIIISSDKEVLIKNLGEPAKLTIFNEVLRAPSPLNLVVVGDSPMMHDLMNAGEDEVRFIAYRNQGDHLKHHYFDLLAELEKQNLNDPFIQFQREMIVGLLMTELLRNHQPSIAIADSYFPGKDIHRASRDTQSGLIFNYLVANSRTATLKETARHFGYEKNYFSRLCRTLFAKSFTEQLAFIRIELAERMLALSNKSIADIGYELGYKNLSSFTAVFKKSSGITPNVYRQQFGLK